MKISVIIPYNKDRGYLHEAIKSVEAQTVPCELVLVYGQKLRSVNCNEGIRRATGNFIKFLDEDDRLTPNCIEESLKMLENYNFIHGNAVTDWGDRQEVYKPRNRYPVFDDIIRANTIHNATVMYRAGLFKEMMFDETLSTAEDWDFNLRLLHAGVKIGYVDKKLAIYRRHDDQMSVGNGADQQARKNCLPRIRAKYADV